MALILVIDDDQDMRNLLRLKLEQSGYEVVEAADGAEGIELYQEKPADLVITDIFMPKKEGLELIREFRKNFLNVKIIAISGGGPEKLNGLPVYDFLELAKKMGALHIFKKPVDFEKLLKAVDDILKPGKG